MKNKQIKRKITTGALAGIVNGGFGGGGGMIVVPLLNNVLLYQNKVAHATAILVIAPMCAVSLIPYLFGGYLNLSVAIPVTIGNIIGGFLGAKLLFLLNPKVVDVLFTILMLVAGIRMVI